MTHEAKSLSPTNPRAKKTSIMLTRALAVRQVKEEEKEREREREREKREERREGDELEKMQ
jgi:hypothetical protein